MWRRTSARSSSDIPRSQSGSGRRRGGLLSPQALLLTGGDPASDDDREHGGQDRSDGPDDPEDVVAADLVWLVGANVARGAGDGARDREDHRGDQPRPDRAEGRGSAPVG